jgi:two-component system cell cycle response regulator
LLAQALHSFECAPLRSPRPLSAAASSGAGDSRGAKDLMSVLRDELSAAGQKAAASSERRVRSAEPTQPIDVLIVDDDDDTGRTLEDAIQSLGYPARYARSGMQALAEHESRPAAIVLTDWTMPGMTGLELCVALKRFEPQPHVVMMTAFDERARLLDALRAGADEFIGKPLSLDELEVRLLAAARMVNAQRALRHTNEALRHASEHEFRVARTDPLTLIPNRLRMDEDLARAIGDAARYGRRYCIAICDIDHFKRYNDRNGHLAGDVALRQVAAALRDGVRSSDTVYRFGGEEFLILFPEQSPEEVAIAVDRIRASVRALAIENAPVSESGYLTISAGIAELDGLRKNEWLLKADTALYRAKDEGRDRVAIG